MWFHIMGLAVCCSAAIAQTPAAGAFAGRWVMQTNDDPERRVFWLEVTSDLSGKFFGATGGRLAELLDAVVERDELRFRVERTFEGPEARTTRAFTRARLAGDALRGSTRIDGREYVWTGRRAPIIADRDDGSWKEGRAVDLLGNPSLPLWETLHDGRKGEWSFRGGVLSNEGRKADFLVTREKFWNFRLQLECRIPRGGNAGVGLRGRYEMQIFDDYGNPPDALGNGSIYSRIAPTVNASRPPGEWQAFDITLIGRQVSITLNGTRITNRAEIEGLCGLPLDPDEERPGPIWLQGDHGPTEYRNVRVTALQRK